MTQSSMALQEQKSNVSQVYTSAKNCSSLVLMFTRMTGHDWWLLMAAEFAGTTGLNCLVKAEGI